MKKLLTAFGFLLALQSLAQTSKWTVQYVADGAGMTNVKAKKSEIELAIAEKKISGKVGCNSFTGVLDYIKGDQIKPIKLTNTKEKCPQNEDRLDNAVLSALKVANKLVVGQDKAKFYNGQNLVLEMVR